jgi:hypothetical protein
MFYHTCLIGLNVLFSHHAIALFSMKNPFSKHAEFPDEYYEKSLKLSDARTKRSAEEHFWQQYGAKILGYAAIQWKFDSDTCNTIQSNTIFKVICAIKTGTYQSQSKLIAYILTVAKNECLEMNRVLQRNTSDDFDDTQPILDEEYDVEYEATQTHRLLCLEKGLQLLKQENPLWYHIVSEHTGITGNEPKKLIAIAKELDEPSNTVTQWYRRARLFLKGYINVGTPVNSNSS